MEQKQEWTIKYDYEFDLFQIMELLNDHMIHKKKKTINGAELVANIRNCELRRKDEKVT